MTQEKPDSGTAPNSNDVPDVSSVTSYLKQLQIQCCKQFQALDTDKSFIEDSWQHDSGGGGITRVIENGRVFEKGGVNFSHIVGKSLPQAASASRPLIAGKPFEATGVSIVMHPVNPFIPTCHMNVRFFIADPGSNNPVWWFGGGYDLTPYYGFDEDCRHWHQTAKSACDEFNPDLYARFKEQCDNYFFVKHRNEPRGIGGLFFDDFDELGFDTSFRLIQKIGESFLQAYLPIVDRRQFQDYDENNRCFQLYRRGRYVEFNLIYDRGTLFGLQSNGRTESILMSLPPKVEWRYNWKSRPGSEEEKLVNYYLQPKDWIEL